MWYKIQMERHPEYQYPQDFFENGIKSIMDPWSQICWWQLVSLYLRLLFIRSNRTSFSSRGRAAQRNFEMHISKSIELKRSFLVEIYMWSDEYLGEHRHYHFHILIHVEAWIPLASPSFKYTLYWTPCISMSSMPSSIKEVKSTREIECISIRSHRPVHTSVLRSFNITKYKVLGLTDQYILVCWDHLTSQSIKY